MTLVLAELAGAVGTVTLDHERRRNALSHALVEEVIAALQGFRQARARVVILRARPARRSSPLATTSTSGATRSAGTTHCAGWYARSMAFRDQ